MTARFFHPQPMQPGELVMLRSDTSHHATQVLRLQQGDPVILFNGEGGEFSGHLAQIRKTACLVQIDRFSDVTRESHLLIELAQAICTNEKMDWIIQKAVEQGVTRIQPLTTRRSVVRLSGERADKRQRHWQRVIISACEQCGRNSVPELLPLLSLSQWFEQKFAQQTETGERPRHHLMLSPAANHRLADLPPPQPHECLALLVGPEGGFTSEEMDAAHTIGFEPIRLGKRILRTESAALVAIAAAQTLWGDY
ncbi:16S rRNA (uracil(1498)-N(3))-methyltransferase [Nitrosomonas halophila]|uniref:Ribosomal RNA small subunit methyltransferase E n=1 Tax=Nitrosomonas halophila TaxID=44576 RepID=A0A1H3HK89_9PROT|nr:16S rRNA (uracil(1498)-N(3))-methyltransferase [Nitrosomonas halophila]SDY15194.1 16S rRNA (uracil1498-N3)-methyltransferase [Nitrosomonas halophila]